jgi:hypothetical protein
MRSGTSKGVLMAAAAALIASAPSNIEPSLIARERFKQREFAR